MKRFEKKIALVTGGSRGIGAAIVRQLAQEGAAVIINYAHNAEPAQALAAEIEQAGGQAFPVEANLEDNDSTKALFRQIGKNFERLDILVNNAGFGVMRPAENLPIRHFERALSLNVRAVLQCSQEAVALMKQGGKIVNVSSIGAARVLPQYTAVGTSKAALETLTRYLGVELAAHNISVNAVQAGPVKTDALRYFHNADHMLASALDQTPVGRLTLPEDVAETVAFLCSEAAFMIRGQTLTVDGGLSLTVHIY